MTEPKYLLTESQMRKLIKVCSYHTTGYEVDITPYLFKDGWVKCSERMPEKGQECIVSCYGLVKQALYTWESYSKLNSGWYANNEMMPILQKRDVSHWMPLPSQPPKEEN